MTQYRAPGHDPDGEESIRWFVGTKELPGSLILLIRIAFKCHDSEIPVFLDLFP